MEGGFFDEEAPFFVNWLSGIIIQIMLAKKLFRSPSRWTRGLSEITYIMEWWVMDFGLSETLIPGGRAKLGNCVYKVQTAIKCLSQLRLE